MDRPRPQELYRHFKGKTYQVITIAKHSETLEDMVVYQALYGDYAVYCRPLSMFMSEVDREKYPNAEQQYRFEKIEKVDKIEKVEKKEEAPAPKFKVDTSYERSAVMEKSIDEEAEELNLDPLVIKFLDADLATDKNDILSKLRPTITDDMIDIMATSVGVVIEKGDVYDRYNDLRKCLTTMEKYESTRLRS